MRLLQDVEREGYRPCAVSRSEMIVFHQLGIIEGERNFVTARIPCRKRELAVFRIYGGSHRSEGIESASEFFNVYAFGIAGDYRGSVKRNLIRNRDPFRACFNKSADYEIELEVCVFISFRLRPAVVDGVVAVAYGKRGGINFEAQLKPACIVRIIGVAGNENVLVASDVFGKVFGIFVRAFLAVFSRKRFAEGIVLCRSYNALLPAVVNVGVYSVGVIVVSTVEPLYLGYPVIL